MGKAKNDEHLFTKTDLRYFEFRVAKGGLFVMIKCQIHLFPSISSIESGSAHERPQGTFHGEESAYKSSIRVLDILSIDTIDTHATSKSFFVNPYFLAEISPYFDNLCFGAFKESTEKSATFPDETATSMKLLFGILRVRDFQPKDITFDSICELLRLAQKFDIQLLYVRCCDFIQLNVNKFPVNVLINILATVTHYGIDSLDSTKWAIAEVLAAQNISKLSSENWSEINDSALVACIIHTSMRNSDSLVTSTTHYAKVATAARRNNYDYDYENRNNCSMCGSYTDSKCEKCAKFVCKQCMAKECGGVLPKHKLDRKLFH